VKKMLSKGGLKVRYEYNGDWGSSKIRCNRIMWAFFVCVNYLGHNISCCLLG
jgi:hypothetical protein